MSLRAGGSARTRAAGPTDAGAGGAAVRVVAVAVAATLLALAVFAASAWRGGEHAVVVEMPAFPSGTAPVASAERADAADEPAEDRVQGEAAADGPAAADDGEGEGEGEAEAQAELAAGFGDPAFFETPMRVLRRSNIRARPTPESVALGRADEGTMVILVDPQPERGYLRVATGELDGWIWGANLEPADPSLQPDAPDALPAATEELAEPTDRPSGRPAGRQ